MSQSPMSRLRRRNALEPMAVFNGPAGGGASGFAALARGLTDFADSIDRTARQAERNQASEAGREAVTRDEEGKIVVKENPFRDEVARREFTAQQAARYVTEIELDARRQSTELHAANGTDPAAFDAAWKGYTEGKLSEVPEAFRERSRQALAALGVQHANQIVMSQAAQAKQDAAVSWTTQTTALQNDVLSLVQAGQMSDPAYMERLAAFSTHLAEGVASGIITQDQATLRSRQIADESEGLGAATVAETAYRRAGRGAAGMAAAERLIESTIVKNPDSSLTPERKNALAGQMMARLRDLEADRRIQAQDAAAKADADVERLRLGINVELATLDAHRRNLIAAGEPEAAQRISRMMEVSSEIRGLAQQPIAAIDARIRELDGKRDKGTATAAEGEALQQAVRVRERKARALVDDAFAYGTTVHESLVGKPAPLDWNNPAALQSAIDTRMRQARVISEREGVPVAPFTQPELAEVAMRAQSFQSPGEQLDFLARATVDLGDDRAADVVLSSLEANGFRNRTGHMRVALERYREGDRVAARRLWSEFQVPDSAIKIENNDDKALKDRVGKAYDAERGAVRALQSQVTGDGRFASLLGFERDAATHIARVRGSGTRASDDGGAMADLYGRQRGIAERGFAAILFPADTNPGLLEAGLRALRGRAVAETAALIPEGVPRMQMERAGQEATWVNAGDGYALALPGAGRPLAGPDGRARRFTLQEILDAGRPVLADQRTRATAPAAVVETGRQGIGGVVGADDPLAAMQAAAEADRKRRGAQ